MLQRVWGYLNEYAAERDDLLDAVDTVFRSGQLVLGESVRGFEREFAEYHGVRHCVGVDNGTNAIALALRACDVGPGDEVITVSNTAAPTVVAIDATGATPVLVDIRADGTYLMDTDQVEASVTPRTRAIVVVHLYGQCADLTALRGIADRHGLWLIEDCAQAHGARRDGVTAGTVGDLAAFSFYPTKVLGAYGDGGAVLTDADDLAGALRRLRYYGMADTYHVVQTPGFNSRLDEVQAEILRRKLRRLDGYLAARRAVAERYDAALAGVEAVRTPVVAPGNTHVYYLYVVRHPERDRIIERMRAEGIALTVSYPWPVHRQTGFLRLGYKKGDLPVTEQAAEEIFSLPMYPSLPPADQDRVLDALLRAIG
ncbi:DegT/DnrJ/EryC1/StrS family aminotransferase [Amycolatopsis sp. WGS_07]|uniref:DegT/DnrJ/EryC1/StrS family aminotransferase n=1 Tax=Amycolatopsis sp. WGS_07 TaxID=3076764 RepID=UPI0038730C06